MTYLRRGYAKIILWLAERSGALSGVLLDHWHDVTGEPRA